MVTTRRQRASRAPEFVLWASGFLSLALFAGLAWYLWPLTPGVVALQLTFTPGAFGSIVHQWSPQALLRYQRHLPFDCVLLVAYGVFGYLLARHRSILRALSPAEARWAPWVLPAGAVLDALENGLHAWLTAWPHVDAAWVGGTLVHAAAGGFSTAKWACLIAFGLLLSRAFLRVRR
jgi:hypothetical protein